VILFYSWRAIQGCPMTGKEQKRISYIVLTGPAILIYSFIIIFPIVFSFSLSFTEWSGFGAPQLIGIQQYLRMLKDPVFYHGLRNNLLVVAVSVFGQIPLGFVLAYVIYRKLVVGGRFFETMIFLPITISAVVVAILWNQIFSPAGIYTALVRTIRNEPRYILGVFENKTYAIFPILFVILWMYTGMYMVIYIANLQKISPSIIEAAIIDGATEPQILGRVILPSMVNVIFTTAVFAISGSLKSFDLIYAMTSGGPAHYTEVIAIYMYVNTFKYYNYGFGSAISIAIVVLSLGLITLIRAVFRRFEARYEA
jgi:raffinose/stachyose/melibiose transport system permease protein